MESDTTSDSASTTGSIVSEEQLPDRFDDNISQNPKNASPEKSGSARHSVANDGGFRSSDPHKEELWAKFIVKIANANYINTDAAAALLLDHGIRITPHDEQTLVAACVIARDMVRQRNARMRKSADVKAMGKKDEFYKIIAAKYGSDFKINAGPAYDGSTFTGSFMDTRKTEKGRAKSIPAADIAKLLSNKLGREITEKNVVEHFAHLKKDSLLADIREKRRQKSELRSIEQEIEESERQRATGDEYAGDMPFPEDESPAVKAARKRFIAAQTKAQKIRLEQWVAENMPQIYQWTTDVLCFIPKNFQIFSLFYWKNAKKMIY